MRSSLHIVSRVMGAVALMLGLLAMLLAAQPAAAQGGNSSIEIHARVCPTDYQGTNYFDDCHANPLDPGYTFTFTDGETREGETNEDGNVSFANMAAGTWTITGGAPGGVTDLYVYCTVDNTGQEVAVEYVTGGIQLDLPADTNVVCDWYIVPESQRGETPTEPAGDQFDLPIYKLACETAPSDQAASDFVMLGTVPEDCVQFEGVNVTITAADGTELGSCVTEATEPCYVTVPIGTTVSATEDLDTVPEGYAPVDDETIEVSIEPNTEAWVLFVTVRTGG